MSTPQISEDRLREKILDVFRESFLRTANHFDDIIIDAILSVVKAELGAALLAEVKSAQVGRVTSERNRKNVNYMSGFGYAANNLQQHKNVRLSELRNHFGIGEEKS